MAERNRRRIEGGGTVVCKKATTWNDLSDDTLLEIMKWLDQRTVLFVLGQVCRRFRAVTKHYVLREPLSLQCPPVIEDWDLKTTIASILELNIRRLRVRRCKRRCSACRIETKRAHQSGLDFFQDHCRGAGAHCQTHRPHRTELV